MARKYRSTTTKVPVFGVVQSRQVIPTHIPQHAERTKYTPAVRDASPINYPTKGCENTGPDASGASRVNTPDERRSVGFRDCMA